MSVKRLFNDRQQFFDSNGDPYSGALLFVYLAGSSTRATTYNSSAGSVANTNPLVLDSAGRLQAEVWVTTGSSYKLVLAASGDGDSITNPSSPIWTEDNITGINDATVAAQDEWVSGPTPTYVSATSFTLAGDQRTAFHVGRRIKTTNSGGNVYSTITVSAFGALTTLTIVNDSGTLDSGLSAVSYGLLSATNPSTPSLLAAAQIAFPATQNPSAGANTLDDYAEVSWSPTIAFGGAAVGLTYTIQSGRATKIGRLVLAEYFVVLSAKGSSVGAATLSGFPHAVNALIGAQSPVNWTALATNWVNLSAVGAGSSVSIKGAAAAAVSNQTALVNTDFGNTTTLMGALLYTV